MIRKKHDIFERQEIQTLQKLDGQYLLDKG